MGSCFPLGPGAEPLDEAGRRALYDVLDGEHRAWATYDQIVVDFGSEASFVEIRESVARNVEALGALMLRCGLEVRENPWTGQAPRFASAHEACEASVAAELARVERCQRLAASTRRRDVLEVLGQLQRAAEEQHLPVLRRHAAGGAG